MQTTGQRRWDNGRPGSGNQLADTLAEIDQHRPGRVLAEKVAYFQTAPNKERVR